MKNELQELYEKICTRTDLRASLIELKKQLKTEENRQAFREICGDNYDVIMKCLVESDPKVRKNAAAILGVMRVQDAADVLMDAYAWEETLFVRPEYVDALAQLDCGEYLAEFHKRLDALAVYDAPENEKKHVQEEMRALRELLLAKEGLKKHTFTGFNRANEVILTTLPAFRDVLAESIHVKKTLLKGGIRMVVGDMNDLLENRLWQEMLFVVHEADSAVGNRNVVNQTGHQKSVLFTEKDERMEKLVPDDRTLESEKVSFNANRQSKCNAVCGESGRGIRFRNSEYMSGTFFAQMSQCLRESDLMSLLTGNHSGELPFYFRIGVQGLPREERGDFMKKAAKALEEAFPGQLANSASHYELELRLLVKKDGTVVPFVKFFTIPDRRFTYRKYSLATGMKPSLAAGLMALAKPYLKEYAQVLDPFCGVGTLLVERQRAVPTRNLYGVDTFGEAIAKARANTKIAKLTANFINRDYFDFTHAYPFDEIITEPPAGASREETDRLYRKFFEKSVTLLSEHGRIVLYSGEMGLVKKYLRLKNQFRLLKEFCISEKSEAYLFILERK